MCESRPSSHRSLTCCYLLFFRLGAGIPCPPVGLSFRGEEILWADASDLCEPALPRGNEEGWGEGEQGVCRLTSLPAFT